jgi:hypothetical protein
MMMPMTIMVTSATDTVVVVLLCEEGVGCGGMRRNLGGSGYIFVDQIDTTLSIGWASRLGHELITIWEETLT